MKALNTNILKEAVNFRERGMRVQSALNTNPSIMTLDFFLGHNHWVTLIRSKNMYFIKEFDTIDLDNNSKLIINFLSGAADILDEKTFYQVTNMDFENIDQNTISALRDRNYIFDSIDYYKEFLRTLNQKLSIEEKKQAPNFLLIPTYNCNLNCSYCYEKGYEIDGHYASDLTGQELAIKMFDAIDVLHKNISQVNETSFKNEDINITLMGGEPLFKKNEEFLSHIFKLLREKNYKVSIITNGFDLKYFINDLKKINLDFLQITLDGAKDIHDSKRYDINGKGTYDKIISNIQLALSEGITVYIRTNVDYDNIENLPELARMLMELKITYHNIYPYIYILQDGGCAGNKMIVNELESLKKIFQLEEKYPEMQIYKKTFHGLRFIESILENKQYEARFSNCAACRNQYILDTIGNIYKCWFGVGNESFRIGNFVPNLNIDSELDNNWHKRDIVTLKKCNDCKYRYICGGGCASRTKIDPITGIRQEKCADFYQILNMYFTNMLKK